MKNDRDLLLDVMHQIIADLPLTQDNWQATAEHAIRQIATLLAHLHDRCDRLEERDVD